MTAMRNHTLAFDVTPLVANLASLDVRQREKARRTLAALGSTATPQLVLALQHPLEWVRWEAATILTMTADAPSAAALVVALKDSSPAVRLAAAEALVAIGKPATSLLLASLADDPQSGELRQGARRVLSALARHGRLTQAESRVYTSLRVPTQELIAPDAAGQFSPPAA